MIRDICERDLMASLVGAHVCVMSGIHVRIFSSYPGISPEFREKRQRIFGR
jgi:hypothetical protein